MKKIKKMLLISILAIFAAIVGMDKAYAANYFTLGNTRAVICEPNTISAGEGTDCYLVGKPNPVSGDAVHGYITYAYTTEYLKLNGAKVNGNLTDANAYFTKAASATSTIPVSGDMPDALGSVVCAYDENIESGYDFGCAIFYTKKGKTAAFSPTTITTGNDKKILPNGDASYGVIGSYQVSLSEEAAGEACGELCVKAWRIPGEGDYAHYKKCQTDGQIDENNNCTGVTSIETPGTTNNYVCQEVHYKGGVNPDTGTFASYTLLVAGALIAIAAITLAKKNTKIYKV